MWGSTEGTSQRQGEDPENWWNGISEAETVVLWGVRETGLSGGAGFAAS